MDFTVSMVTQVLIAFTAFYDLNSVRDTVARIQGSILKGPGATFCFILSSWGRQQTHFKRNSRAWAP